MTVKSVTEGLLRLTSSHHRSNRKRRDHEKGIFVLYTRALTAFAVCSCLVGCESTFDDLRPASSLADAGTSMTDAATNGDAATRVLSAGTFEGRTGYIASGSAQIVETGTGFELIFGGDFDVQGVPGPVVYVSDREAIGRDVDPARDIDVGVLQASSGMQRYPVPAGAEDATYAWVYCRPFRVEVARAPLSPVAP